MSTESIVRTVLGDVTPATLGALDYHEHLFQESPLLPGDDLNDEDKSGLEAETLHNAGISTMIESTPTGLGRNVEAVARISVRTGLTIVHTTGAHHAGHYASGHPLLDLSVKSLGELFTADITDGFRKNDGTFAANPSGAPIQAGLAKAGIRYWSIGSFEHRVLRGVAEAHRATGCAIMVHLDFGSATHEVLDILEELGVPAARVVLAHIDRNLDAELHASLAFRGAYLGYDGMARHRDAPDSAIVDCIEKVVELGGVERIVLGGDVARATRYRSYGGIPGLDYLPLRFLPRLAKRLSPGAYQTIVTSNGSRLLAFVPSHTHRR